MLAGGRRIPSATRAASPEGDAARSRGAVAFNANRRKRAASNRAFAILAQVEFGARHSYLKPEPYLLNRWGVRLLAAGN